MSEKPTICKWFETKTKTICKWLADGCACPCETSLMCLWCFRDRPLTESRDTQRVWKPRKKHFFPTYLTHKQNFFNLLTRMGLKQEKVRRNQWRIFCGSWFACGGWKAILLFSSKSTKLKNMAAAGFIGNISELDPKKELWTNYQKRLEVWMKANKCKDGQKVAIFLTTLRFPTDTRGLIICKSF